MNVAVDHRSGGDFAVGDVRGCPPHGRAAGAAGIVRRLGTSWVPPQRRRRRGARGADLVRRHVSAASRAVRAVRQFLA